MWCSLEVQEFECLKLNSICGAMTTMGSYRNSLRKGIEFIHQYSFLNLRSPPLPYNFSLFLQYWFG